MRTHLREWILLTVAFAFLCFLPNVPCCKIEAFESLSFNQPTIPKKSSYIKKKNLNKIESDSISCPTKTEALTESNLHVMTVASDMRPNLQHLMNTCLWQGIDIEVVGLGLYYPGNGQKLLYMKEYLEKLPSNDILLFVDAYDVLIVANKNTILEKFLSFNTRILVAAEKNCYPLTELRSLYPNSPTPFKYINAGVIIGYVSDLLYLIEELHVNPYQSDQKQLSQYFINHPGCFQLDYNVEIALCMYEVDDSEIALKLAKKKVYCVTTDSYPCVLHFNGGSYRNNYGAVYHFFEPK